MSTNASQTCHTCGESIACTSNSLCWCMTYPPILSITEEDTNCLCKECLKKAIIVEAKNWILEKKYTEIVKLGPVSHPIEGLDYYINENEKWVFTTWYHLRSSTCCENDCKHCPY